MHLQGLPLLPGMQIDGLIAADIHTFVTRFAPACFSIDNKFPGESQGGRQMDRFGEPHVVMEGIGAIHRAYIAAIAAGGTAVVHHLGCGDHLHLHISPFTLNGFHFCLREQADTGIVADSSEINLHATGGRTELREVVVHFTTLPPRCDACSSKITSLPASASSTAEVTPDIPPPMIRIGFMLL